MPHLVLEYTNTVNIPIEKWLHEGHHTLMKSTLFKEEDIKVRAQEYSHALVGGHPKPFLHCTVWLMPGRTVEQKKSLTQLISKTYKELGKTIPDMVITVNLIELDTAYTK